LEGFEKEVFYGKKVNKKISRGGRIRTWTFPQNCGTLYRAPLHPRNKKSQQVFRWLSLFLILNKSGWQDSNLDLPAILRDAIPGFATPQKQKKPTSICWLSLFLILNKSGWQDSNLRPPHPKCGAIPGYATPRT
jgi:hypothetical protein